MIEESGPYKIIEMRAATGYATFRFQVLDENGQPATWEQMRYSWPDGFSLNEVKLDGWAEHGMGHGEYYDPSQTMGPAWAQVDGGKSDVIHGVGMIAGTDHDHFDVVTKLILETI